MTARKAHRRGLPKPAVAADSKPYCFVSFSTREAHVPILVDCLRIVLGSNFEVKLTPSALESGASQRGQIVSLIEDSAFAVVILDGLKEAVSSFQPENLDRPTPGSKTLARLIAGIALHGVYHAGQIQLIKKLLKTRRSR